MRRRLINGVSNLKEPKALGVDLAFRSVGLALVTRGDIVEGLGLIEVPRLGILKTYDFLMGAYQLNEGLLRKASVVFIERPSVGLLTKLMVQRRTSILSIEDQALGRLIFLLALRKLGLSPEVFFLDPGRVAQSTRNLLLTEELWKRLGDLKMTKKARRDASARAKFVRRVWLALNAPSVNWADTAISEHESDAAHLACVGLSAYLLGQIEKLATR